MTNDFAIVEKKLKSIKRVGRPCFSQTDDNVSIINDIARKYRRLYIRMTTEMVNIDKETFRQLEVPSIIFNMTKDCTIMVPKKLLMMHLLNYFWSKI